MEGRKMEKVKVKRGKVELNFNPKIYCYNCIIQTKKKFNKICRISIKKDSNNIKLVLIPKERNINLEILGYEFFNHALNTIKETTPELMI